MAAWTPIQAASIRSSRVTMAEIVAPANAPDTLTVAAQTSSPTKRPRDDPAAIRKRVMADNRPLEAPQQGKVTVFAYFSSMPAS